LKPEWWGSPLAQEKYQGRKKTYDKGTIIVIVIIIIIIISKE
jgi:hypothetical protein